VCIHSKGHRFTGMIGTITKLRKGCVPTVALGIGEQNRLVRISLDSLRPIPQPKSDAKFSGEGTPEPRRRGRPRNLAYGSRY
jgi:hypothetical protein